MHQHPRTLSSKKVLHLVFKCNKSVDLFKNKDYVCSTLTKQADKANIRLYKFSVQRDHIHIALQIPDRESYKAFVRSFTGLMGRKFGRGLWKFRPYTRIVEWGRDYVNLENYIYRNELEVRGVISYQLRFQKKLKCRKTIILKSG